MLLELFLAITLGIIFGTITGLIPGIHINLIGAILIPLSATFLGLTTPIILVIFIVSMALTHSFIDFIPSVFLSKGFSTSQNSTVSNNKRYKNTKY